MRWPKFDELCGGGQVHSNLLSSLVDHDAAPHKLDSGSCAIQVSPFLVKSLADCTLPLPVPRSSRLERAALLAGSNRRLEPSGHAVRMKLGSIAVILCLGCKWRRSRASCASADIGFPSALCFGRAAFESSSADEHGRSETIDPRRCRRGLPSLSPPASSRKEAEEGRDGLAAAVGQDEPPIAL